MKMRAEFKETAQEQGRLEALSKEEALRGSEGHGSSSAAVSCNGPYDTSDTAFGGTEVFHKTVYWMPFDVRWQGRRTAVSARSKSAEAK